ncbi:MAG: hypothetical protein PUE13_06995, partial [Clostridiales bacterium]|nr:hypothetical protein [Clostridiales bacterium]
MKSKLLKGVTYLSAAAMIAAVMPMAAVSAEETQAISVFADNFDSYGVSGLSLVKGAHGAWTDPYTDDNGTYESTATDVNGNYLIDSQDVAVAHDPDFGDAVWVAKTFNGLWGDWNTSAAGITAKPNAENDNVLAICSYATSTNKYPTVALNSTTMLDGYEYTYTFDILKTEKGYDGKTGGGIRFNVSADRSSYYELQLPGNHKTVAANYGGIRKVVNGVSEELTVSADPAYEIGGDIWYTVTLTVNGGIIEWKVVKPDGTVAQNGTCVDAFDVIPQADSHIEFFAGGQANTFALYDNLSITRKAPEQEDTGNFELLPLTEVKTEKNSSEQNFVGRWKIASNYNGPTFKIIDDGEEHGHVLAIESRIEWNKYASFPSAYNTTMATAKKTDYNYKFDIKRAESLAGGGICFNYTDSNNFYELYFTGGNAGTGADKGTMLRKRVNGVDTILAADIKTYIDNNPNGIWSLNNRITNGRWYSVDLKVLGGIIEWTVYDASGNIASVGSYDDRSEYYQADNMGVRLFAAGQFNQFTYFDNISVTPITKDTGSFEDFDVVSKTSNSIWKLPLAGEWYIPAGQANDATFEIVQETDSNKALKITSAADESETASYAAITNSKWRNYKAGVNTYDFDMWKEKFSSGSGIRFNVSKDGQSYYELMFGATNDLEADPGKGIEEQPNDRPRTYLNKVVNGVSTSLPVTLEVNPEFENVWNTISKYQGMKPGVWNTVHIEVVGGKIDFTVDIKNNGQHMGGKRSLTGSYTDSEPLEEINTDSYFVSCNGYTMIDNAVK